MHYNIGQPLTSHFLKRQPLHVNPAKVEDSFTRPTVTSSGRRAILGTSISRNKCRLSASHRTGSPCTVAQHVVCGHLRKRLPRQSPSRSALSHIRRAGTRKHPSDEPKTKGRPPNSQVRERLLARIVSMNYSAQIGETAV